jgi:hypothetical protein
MNVGTAASLGASLEEEGNTINPNMATPGNMADSSRILVPAGTMDPNVALAAWAAADSGVVLGRDEDGCSMLAM